MFALLTISKIEFFTREFQVPSVPTLSRNPEAAPEEHASHRTFMFLSLYVLISSESSKFHLNEINKTNHRPR